MRSAPLAAVLVVIGCASPLLAQPSAKRVAQPDLAAGQSLFHERCSICHGVNADGYGTAEDGSFLEPRTAPAANLTTLSRRNSGTFPADRVRAAIRQPESTPSHGTPDMPAWGDVFYELKSRPTLYEARVRNLTAYIESIQKYLPKPRAYMTRFPAFASGTLLMLSLSALLALSSVRPAAQRAALPDEGAAYSSVTIVLPNGSVPAGRQAFVDLKCTACHRVPAEATFPPPFSESLGPDLGPRGPHRTPSDLATAIIAPSHAISLNVSSELKARLRNETLSPMGDFSQAMTVRQLSDLVAYLRSIGGRPAS